MALLDPEAAENGTHTEQQFEGAMLFAAFIRDVYYIRTTLVDFKGRGID